MTGGAGLLRGRAPGLPQTLAGRPHAERLLSDRQRAVLCLAAEYLGRRNGRGFLVGGLLRDQVLGVATNDIDLVIRGAEPFGLGAFLHGELGASRPAVFPRFDTVMVFWGGLQIEICPLHKGLEADARRRDFTMNCLFAELEGGRRLLGGLLDPTGRAVEDLRAKRIRTPDDPLVTLWLDPARILRAARFHAVLGFAIDPGLSAAMSRMAYLLGHVSRERVRLELERILVSSRLASTFRMMQRLGILDMVMPQLASTHGYHQRTPYHAYDLFTHLVKTASNTSPSLALRLAGLLHDLGKVSTQAPKGDRMVYYGHERASREMAEAMLARLRFSKRLTREVSFLIENHMINYTSEWSDRAVQRFVHKMGSRLDSVLALALADKMAQRPGVVERADAGLAGRIATLPTAMTSEVRSPLDGGEIMALLGIEQGPLVGEAKRWLLARALDAPGPMAKEEAAKLLLHWARRRGHLERCRGRARS